MADCSLSLVARISAISASSEPPRHRYRATKLPIRRARDVITRELGPVLVGRGFFFFTSFIVELLLGIITRLAFLRIYLVLQEGSAFTLDNNMTSNVSRISYVCLFQSVLAVLCWRTYSVSRYFLVLAHCAWNARLPTQSRLYIGIN